MTRNQTTRRLRVSMFCSLSLLVLLAVFALHLPLARSAEKIAANTSASASALPFVNGAATQRPTPKGATPAHATAGNVFGKIPLVFEPNLGQTAAQVKYMARAHGYSLFLTSQEALFALPVGTQTMPVHRGMSPAELEKAMRMPQSSDSSMALVRMQMLGANAAPRMEAENLQPGRTNYILGNDPKKWHNNVPWYGQVHYRDVYPGIDLTYHGTQQLEFDFVVNPGANPDKIALSFSGSRQVRTDASGNLVLGTPAGELRLLQPVAYQEKDGARQPVSARFVTRANKVAFELGAYDRTRQLVIDPSISFATYYGGAQEDTGAGVAVDASGNIYVVGTTDSNTLPGPQPFPIGPGGEHDGYLVQMTPSGTAGFLTIYGGTLDDFPQAVAVDSSGIYIAGTTQSKDFPVTSGAAQTIYGGNGQPGTGHGAGDGFVIKLTLDGQTEQWGTYAGGNDLDIAFALAVDSSENVYAVGETFSTTAGFGAAFTPKNALPQGGTENGSGDGFVVEVKNDGSQFIIMSYIGGSQLDFATGVSWNPINGGTVYITGDTQSPNLPVTSGAFQPQCGTGSGRNCNLNNGVYLDDAFVAAFNPANTSSYAYFTYLGGESVDIGFAITTDASGNAYLTGETQSYKFPVSTSPAAYQSELGSGSLTQGIQNAFVTVLNPTGTGLVYSTYLGGSQNDLGLAGTDKGLGIALDTSNMIYLTGQTTSTNFPLFDPTQQVFGGGNEGQGQFNSDAFYTEIDSAGDPPVLSTYIGGSGDEDILNGFIAVDNTGGSTQGNVYVVGDTNSTNLPIQVSTGVGALLDSSLNDGQGIQQQCPVLNEQQQQVYNVTCPDAFVYLFTPNTSGLLVSLVGAGTGTVTSSPSGITCPGIGTCGASFITGTQVTLTATATNGSVFTDWEGLNSPCTGSGACAPILSSNQFVTARFTPPATPQLNVTLAGAGTVTSNPSGITCPGSCFADFPESTTVVLSATAASNSLFAGWSGGYTSSPCSGTGTCSQTLTVNDSVTATFIPKLSVTLAGSGTGSVTSNLSGIPGRIDCPAACQAGFNLGATVVLTPTPAAGSTFAGWSGGSCSGTGTCSQTLNAGETVTATFNLVPTFDLAASALTPPSVTPGGSATSSLTVTSIGAFNSSVSFSCAITPVVTPAPTCNAGAVTPGAGGKATTTLTVSTTGPMSELAPFGHHARPLYALLLPIGGVMFFGVGFGSTLSRKKKLLGLLFICLIVSGLVFSVACGNGNKSTAGGSTGGTPAGTYAIQVTGTSGSTKVAANQLTLIVQ